MNIPIPDSGIPVQPGDDHFMYKGVYHPIVWINDLPYRPRVETLVVMNGNMVYVRLKDGNKLGSSGNGESYELPGGSIDADSSAIQQAENEVNEEALISIKNIYDTGIMYYANYPSGFLMNGGDTPLEYTGHISSVFVAEYNGIHDRNSIEEKDLDPKISENGKFYPITKVVSYFRREHINALLNSPYVSSSVKGAIRILDRKNNPLKRKTNHYTSDDVVGDLFFVSKDASLERIEGSNHRNGSLHINTKNTPVVRVFNSIDEALTGYDSVFGSLKNGDTIYAYTIDCKIGCVSTPSNEESPSSKITGELWIRGNKSPIKVKRLGLVRVISTGVKDKYYYGKNSTIVGEIEKLKHEWVAKDSNTTNVMESSIIIPNNKLYHGSTYLIEEFKPMSLDLGNAQQEPGWSTFAFADYTLALRFGLMRAIQKVKDYYGDRCKDVVCSWDVENKKPFISAEHYKLMKPLITDFKYYVYTIDATDLDVGIGNDENFPEYTFRESGVVPESTDIIKIDGTLLEQNLIVLPVDTNTEEYSSTQERSINGKHNRGWYAVMMTKDYNNGLASAQLQKAVKDGKLKPGDDIVAYMGENGVAFDDDSISMRSYVSEACKNVDEARKFVSEVGKLAKKYDANYFVVTDGASGISNKGNAAVKHARDCHIDWEKKHGSDPYEDWSKSVMESKSTINSKYKPKGKMSLSSFKRVHLTQTIIDRYKKEYPFLKHVRCKDTNEYICDGYIWFDDDELVGMVGSCEYTDDKTRWVVSLEITNKYKGYGLSKQILDYAVKTMNCKYLSVNKNNKIAKKVYDSYGFKVYQEDNTMYYMTIDKNNRAVVSATESAEYSSVNKYPVFIALMHTGTSMSRTIRTVTHDEFTHATISFNSKLDPLYSFGTKNYPGNDHGLVQQEPTSDFYRHYRASYSVYVMYVSKSQRDKMLQRLQQFIDNADSFKFDIPALVACALKIPTEFRKKFFCSRFCMEIIGQGIDLEKVPSLWSPQQMSELNNISLVNKGDDFYKYDYRITEKNLKKIKAGETVDIVVESDTPRSELPDDVFGLPEKRKYPLQDPSHVKSAIKFFNYVSKEDEKELAENILKKIDEYGMKGEISATKKNRIYPYLVSSGLMESLSQHDKDSIDNFIMNLPTESRRRAIERLSTYNKENLLYEDWIYINGNIVGAAIAFRNPDNENEAHIVIMYMDEANQSLVRDLTDGVVIGVINLYSNIDTVTVLDLTDEQGSWSRTRDELSAITDITESWIPVMEAPNDEDTATDYTEETDPEEDDGTDTAQEETPEEEEAPTDYTEETDPETDDGEDEEANQNETGDTGEEDTVTDYTDEAGGMDDTEGADAQDADTTTTQPQNGNLIDNNVLKNYSVLSNFEKLYNLTKEVSDSMDSVVMPTKLQNTVLAQVLKNLSSIKEFILSYVKFQFSSDNYAQNLYYYNIVLQALNLNLELLKRNRDLKEEK